MTVIKKIINKIKYWASIIVAQIKNMSSLSDKGERVDIRYKNGINTDIFDIYQKSHYQRYQYALQNIKEGDIVADLACGTGYGSVMLSQKAASVLGVDINPRVINKIKRIYKKMPNVSFLSADLLKISYEQEFDDIISFETIEHFEEKDIQKLFFIFYKALKPGGQLVFSTPFIQEKSEQAVKMGFHKTFYIDENKIKEWLNQSGFKSFSFRYQNYKTHEVLESLDEKDFIICIAKK